MHKLSQVFIGLVISCSSSPGQEITVKVFNPTDVYPPSYSPEFAGKPVIYDFMKPLILQLQQAKPGDFISAAGAKDTLKWRLQHFTIISAEVVAVKFTEGHVIVIGIFTHNTTKKQWELATEVGGQFKTKIYDEITGQPKQDGEQAVAPNGP